eukprot:11189390-Lingulodinium_polyedra.AAC.1
MEQARTRAAVVQQQQSKATVNNAEQAMANCCTQEDGASGKTRATVVQSHGKHEETNSRHSLMKQHPLSRLEPRCHSAPRLLQLRKGPVIEPWGSSPAATEEETCDRPIVHEACCNWGRCL